MERYVLVPCSRRACLLNHDLWRNLLRWIAFYFVERAATWWATTTPPSGGRRQKQEACRNAGNFQGPWNPPNTFKKENSTNFKFKTIPQPIRDCLAVMWDRAHGVELGKMASGRQKHVRLERKDCTCLMKVEFNFHQINFVESSCWIQTVGLCDLDFTCR